jgi:KUP system potassium uptake protein
MQAVQLGYVPRLEILHTSSREFGQVYIPAINWVLMVACIGLVLAFRSSSNLAAAYGVGVSTDMVITTVLFYIVARERWRWNAFVVGGLAGVLLVVDLAFFGANILKIPQGGWFPLVVAAVVFTLLTTWKRGRLILSERLDAHVEPLESFLEGCIERPPNRVAGTAIFMYRSPTRTPYSLAQNLKTNKVLHERVILLAVKTEEVPRVRRSQRVTLTPLGNEFYQVVMRFGFMEKPNVPRVLRNVWPDGAPIDLADVTYFVGRKRCSPPNARVWPCGAKSCSR